VVLGFRTPCFVAQAPVVFQGYDKLRVSVKGVRRGIGDKSLDTAAAGFGGAYSRGGGNPRAVSGGVDNAAGSAGRPRGGEIAVDVFGFDAEAPRGEVRPFQVAVNGAVKTVKLSSANSSLPTLM
jgi:hypothetical protein